MLRYLDSPFASAKLVRKSLARAARERGKREREREEDLGR